MGLRDFLFGPELPSDEGIEVTKEPAKHPHYGHLASERDDLVRELHERRGTEIQHVEEQRRLAQQAEQEPEEEPEEKPEEEARKYHVPQRFERAAGRLQERLRTEHRDLMPRWYRQRRKLGKYMSALEEAESRQEAHGLFRRAKQLSPSRGSLKKLEGKLESASKSLYNKYEGGEISKTKFSREQRALKRSERDVRRLMRWR